MLFEPDRRTRLRPTPQAHIHKNRPEAVFVYVCLGPGSNRRPLPLQGNALPTELPKHLVSERCLGKLCLPKQVSTRIPKKVLFSNFPTKELLKGSHPRNLVKTNLKRIIRRPERVEVWFQHIEVECERKSNEHNVPQYTENTVKDTPVVETLEYLIVVFKDSVVSLNELT